MICGGSKGFRFESQISQTILFGPLALPLCRTCTETHPPTFNDAVSGCGSVARA